jgi:very-short-patch-repair endonuclease
VGTESPSRRPDRLIAGLAARQHGVVARRQLLRAGLTARQVNVRLANGRLHEVHRGVYLVGHAVPTTHGRDMAALLACGRSATLSHRSAAALWELLAYPATAPAFVTVPPGRSAGRPGVRVYRAAVPERDIRWRARMPLTSPPRTILDLAADLDSTELERVVAEAGYRKLASERELRQQLARNRGKRGNARLRGILGLTGGARFTRSAAERRMLRLLRRAGLVGYETNARIHGYEVDVLWRSLDFAVEIDGYDAHSGRLAFERDRLKLATLKSRGVDVMSVTPRQLRDDPDGVHARLLGALRRFERARAGSSAGLAPS